MLERFLHRIIPIDQMYLWLLHYSYWQWWVSMSFLVSLIFLLGPWPLRPNPRATGPEAAAAITRRLVYVLVLILGVLWPVLLAFLSPYAPWDANQRVLNHWVTQGARWWPLFPLGCSLGTAIRWYVAPRFLVWYSAFQKRMRLKQASDKRSEITDELPGIETLTYDPRPYYRLKEGLVFIGLDEKELPQYWRVDELKERHLEIVGGTRKGKGCIIQVILDQLTRLGWGVFVADPKWDKDVPMMLHALHASCQHTGREFRFHDMTEKGGMSWEPFAGSPGTEMNHNVDRLISAFRLNDVADNSSVFKASERVDIMAFAHETSLRLGRMLSVVNSSVSKADMKGEKVVRRYFSGIREWAMRQAFRQCEGRSLFSVAEAIEKNWVVYCRGDPSDTLVQDGLRLMALEYYQELKRLAKPDRHFVIVIDEVSEVLDNNILQALRTMLTFNATLIIVYQGVLSMELIHRADVRGGFAVNTMHENCECKIVFGVNDNKTAKWVSDESGTKEIMVPVRETTEQKGRGARWEGTTSYQREEVPFIHGNVAKRLPRRTAVFFESGMPAKILRTTFVPVKEEEKFVMPEWTPPADMKPLEIKVKKPVKSKDDVIYGVLLAHGRAPFQFQDGRRESYYIKLDQDGAEVTKWGIDFERALMEAKTLPKVGDKIGIKQVDVKPVVVKEPIKDTNGKVTGYEDKRTTRSVFQVEKAGFFKKPKAA